MPSLGQNMGFEVVLTSQAQLDFRDITNYLLYKLKSDQAADSLESDMENTIERLFRIADRKGLQNPAKPDSLLYRANQVRHENMLHSFYGQTEEI